MARTLRPTSNDLRRTRRATIELLNRQLADIVELQAKQSSHCNAGGPHFIGLQDLFDALADELFDTVAEVSEESTDGIAERA